MKSLFALLVLASPAFAAGLLDPSDKAIDEYTIDLEGRYWFAKLSGRAEGDSGILDGSNINLKESLDLKRPSRPVIEGAGRLRMKKIQIRAAYYQALFEESKHLSETIVFQGSKYTIGTEVNSEATIRTGALDLTLLIVDEGSAKTIGLEIGVGLGGRWLGFDGRISRKSGAMAEEATENAILPVVNAFASVGFSNVFMVNLDAAAMKLPGNFPKISGTFLDLTLEARMYIAKFVYIAGGYRFLLCDANWHSGADTSVDLRLQGIFVGLGISF